MEASPGDLRANERTVLGGAPLSPPGSVHEGHGSGHTLTHLAKKLGLLARPEKMLVLLSRIYLYLLSALGTASPVDPMSCGYRR